MKTLVLGAMFHSRQVRRAAWTLGLAAAALAALLTMAMWASASGSQDPATSSDATGQPLSLKEQKRKAQALRREQAGPWKKWLAQDVVYIITDEEKAAFKRLQTDEERQQFVDQFWLRRDPTPDTIENEVKEEHYRRLAYVNYRYSTGIPGWKTDRGMIYIKYGPPDEIDSHPQGVEVPIGGPQTSTYPFEQWRYRFIDGIGTNVIIDFVDTTMSGEYHMTMDPSEKDALLYAPGTGPTLSEQVGPSTKTQRFQRTDGTHPGGTGADPAPVSMDEFERIERLVSQRPRFKDLAAVADSTIRYNTLAMQVQIDYIKVTDATDLCNISVAFNNEDLQFTTKDGMAKATVNLYGRIISESRRPVDWFEDAVEVSFPAERMPQVTLPNVYFKSIPIPPGAYRLNVVAKDVVAGTLNNAETHLDVPRYDEGQLTSSSVILADQMKRVPAKYISTSDFVIRSSKIRPRVSEAFRRYEKLGIYAEFYNFGTDEKNRQKPDGTIEYEVTNTGTKQVVFALSEELGKTENASPSLVTVEKFLPLNQFEPGSYSIKLKVVDRQSKQTVTTPPARFEVTS